MTIGWLCITLWIGSNVAFGAWRLYVTREIKVMSEPSELNMRPVSTLATDQEIS
jgi:hypothetical protein